VKKRALTAKGFFTISVTSTESPDRESEKTRQACLRKRNFCQGRPRRRPAAFDPERTVSFKEFSLTSEMAAAGTQRRWP
jgi:hypothetical protein